MKCILGKKIEMSQVFDGKGNLVPVTLVEAGPCYVLQKKTKEKDGYEACQLGFGKITKAHKIKKTMKGKEYCYLREFPTSNSPFSKEVGEEVNAADFKEGDTVAVVGVSKGKGFQGGVKRHGFAGRNSSHGAKHESRTVGSIGQRFPQHTIKGRRMPGRMGADRVTVKGLEVIKIEGNVMALKGAVPGHRGTLLEIVARS